MAVTDLSKFASKLVPIHLNGANLIAKANYAHLQKPFTIEVDVGKCFFNSLLCVSIKLENTAANTTFVYTNKRRTMSFWLHPIIKEIFKDFLKFRHVLVTKPPTYSGGRNLHQASLSNSCESKRVNKTIFIPRKRIQSVTMTHFRSRYPKSWPSWPRRRWSRWPSRSSRKSGLSSTKLWLRTMKSWLFKKPSATVFCVNSVTGSIHRCRFQIMRFDFPSLHWLFFSSRRLGRFLNGLDV